MKCNFIVFGLWLSIAGFAQTVEQPVDTPQRANDFTYTLASEEQGTLYEIQSERTLLYFYNPTCEDCQLLMEQLSESDVINRLIANKRLTVLAVYPEEADDIWEEHAELVPKTWINGYDQEAKINIEGIYIITKFPALYLLDKDKNIILNETTLEEVVKQLRIEN
ncbi:MAG: thioredoxin family protein [Tannerella sp.]|nr:thioredoxin family protein [Tannerella sp.]